MAVDSKPNNPVPEIEIKKAPKAPKKPKQKEPTPGEEFLAAMKPLDPYEAARLAELRRRLDNPHR